MNIKETVSKLTLEEKASLCSGKDFWNTKAIERLGIPSIMLTDGPHGLRKQVADSDHLGLNASVASTCFPPATGSANSFDRKLMKEIGEAIGEECVKEDVSIILGPGLNIKRSPLCGRNFEYFSEDPLVSGEMAGGLVSGVQGKNVGACLKHFACNNQEKGRMLNDSVVDERALREIYLTGFEIAVKKSKPWTMMCSYNKINEVYACENKKLLTDIARNEWGFDGFVVTDWGAMTEKVNALKAGLELEMPATGGATDKMLVDAVKKGQLDEKVLNKAVERILTVLEKTQKKNAGATCDLDAHNALARKASTKSAVLLKNEDNCLPLDKNQNFAIIGRFAKEPRFQGGGSSKINPTMVTSSFDELTKCGVKFEYADGYDNNYENKNAELTAQAVNIAKGKDAVVIFAGLPDEYESEGFDREHINIPVNMSGMIEEVVKVNNNVILVLFHGSAIKIPSEKSVKAVLSMSLGGQAVGGASIDLLFGKACPSGRLAETYPLDINDNPTVNNFADLKMTKYKESIFVGYRYYDTANVPVQFPFGFGLSYTNFEYSNLTLSKNSINDDEKLNVSVKVKNTGKFDAEEVVQLYVSAPSGKVMRAKKELKGFEKVFVKCGETVEVKFTLDKRAFAYYNTSINNWHVESGEYEILICKNAQDTVLTQKVTVKSTAGKVALPDFSSSLSEYYNVTADLKNISDEKFAKILGREVPANIPSKKGSFTLNSTLGEIKVTKAGKKIYDQTMDGVAKQFGEMPPDIAKMMEIMIIDMPLRSMIMFSNGAVNQLMLLGLVDMMNGKTFSGIIKLIKSRKK